MVNCKEDFKVAQKEPVLYYSKVVQKKPVKHKKKEKSFLTETNKHLLKVFRV